MPMPYLHQELTVGDMIEALKNLPQDYTISVCGVEPCIYVYDKKNYVLLEAGRWYEEDDEEASEWE